jgi:preprotein translocase subunit SecF
MRQRPFWVAVSLILAVGSLILSLMPAGAYFTIGSTQIGVGPNYGTDFRGGTELEVRFTKPVTPDQVRTAVDSVPGFSSPDIVAVGDPSEYRYLIRVQEHSSVGEQDAQKVRAALCFRGSSPDKNGKEVPDPELDKQRCDPQVFPLPTEVKISPGGDMIAVRYEWSIAGEAPNLVQADGDHQKLDSKWEDKLRQALEGVNVKLRGSQGNNSDFAVKGHETAQLREYRVEIKLKSMGDRLLEELRSPQKLGPDRVPATADRVEWVGPRAGRQLRDAAIKSILYAIVFMMAYVAFRFDLRFAPGGILALFHDALVVIGVFIVTRREISLSTIAAILTIVGYSMSDTVIIYDRIRENLNKHRGLTFDDIINLSVSETLSRTVLTSLSVLLSVAGLFVWGTGVLKDFALALFVGVIAGTYSSIFVAAPLTEWIDRRFFGSSAMKSKRQRKRSKTGVGGAKEQVQHQL